MNTKVISLFFIGLFLMSCSTTSSVPHLALAIQCNAEYLSSTELQKLGGLPIRDLKGTTVVPNGPRIEELRKILERFNAENSSILHEIFAPLLAGRKFNIRVIGTQGVPDPYDAWTTHLKDGNIVIVFNLDLWTDKDFEQHGLPLIRHEVTHVLIHELVPTPNNDDFVAQLQYITLNEGIAHYIGYTRDRTSLLIEKEAEWKSAESQLENAYKVLGDDKVSTAAKEELLRKANTGKFWSKYGAISGMFRIARLYENKGATGIREAILNRKLPL